MSETVTTSEYATWLAVMVRQPRPASATEVGEAGDSRPDLVPRPAHRTLYVAAEVNGET
jgi:hypothetical protein